jgi:hypothetical protein
MSARVIKTEAPGKGDLVVGHEVYAFFPKLPAVPAKVVAVSASGASVTIQIDAVLAVLGSMKRRWEFSWRGKHGTYQPKGSKSMTGCGLARVVNRQGLRP